MKTLLIALLAAITIGLAASGTAEAACFRYCRQGPWFHNQWGYGRLVRGWGLG
jgi:hypothetical protein